MTPRSDGNYSYGGFLLPLREPQPCRYATSTGLTKDDSHAEAVELMKDDCLERSSSTWSMQYDMKDVAAQQVSQLDQETETAATVRPWWKRWLSRKIYDKYIPRSKYLQAFAIITLAQWLLCTVLGLTAAIPILGLDHGYYFGGVMITALSILIFESTYQVVLMVDAGRRKNIVQVFGVCANNVCLTIVFALPVFRLPWLYFDQDRIRLFYTLFGVVALSTLLLLATAWLGRHDFEWSVYRHLSSVDKSVRGLYLKYQMLIALLHLTFFFLVGFWIASVFQYILVGPGLALGVASLLLTAYAIRTERVAVARTGLILLLVDIVLVGVQIAMAFSWYQSKEKASEDDRWLMMDGMTLFKIRVDFYGALAAASLAAAFCASFLCYRNFGKGLKPYLQKGSVAGGEFGRERTGSSVRAGSEEVPFVGRRMDLD